MSESMMSKGDTRAEQQTLMDSDYRSVCNDATLQSDKRGFFLDFAEMVEEEGGKAWVANFKNLPSHRLRIKACLEDPKVCHIVHGTLSKIQQIFRGKAAKFAKSKMDEGEYWLRKGKVQRALASTNLAVIRAPAKESAGVKPEDLMIFPLSLWLRSEILLDLSDYQHALNDIQLALKHQLPSNLKAEAYKRMGECYLKIGDKKKAVVSLNVAKASGNKELEEECNRIISNIESYFKPTFNKKDLPDVTCSLPDMPGISNSLKLHKDPNCGRYFKAVVPISVGEVVASEEPYTSVLFVEKHGTHCLHCFSRLKAPIPCNRCSGVAFCSNDCLVQGLKYHKWECPYLELQIGSGMSVLSYLSLRIITQHDLEYFKNSKNADHPLQKLHNLEGHLEQRDGQDLFRRTLMALFLLQILRHGGYFKRKNDSEVLCKEFDEEGIGKLSEDEITIGCHLLSHLLVLQYNAHEVYETIIPERNPTSQGKTNYVGLALYLNTSMFNHQCKPTLARYFSGRKIILRAQHPILAGEEVSENYGPVFTMRTKEQRQKLLSGRYLFNCKCLPCIMDWPKLEYLMPETVFFRCTQNQCIGSVPETGICQICGNKQDVQEKSLLFNSYQEDWEKAVELVKLKKYTEAEKVTIHYITCMWKVVSQPSKNLCLAMEVLRTIWANTSGNVSILNI